MTLDDATLDRIADAVMERIVRRLHGQPLASPRRLLTGAQLRQALGGLSLETHRQLMAEGLPRLGAGEETRFDLEAVKAWLAEREESADRVEPRPRRVGPGR